MDDGFLSQKLTLFHCRDDRKEHLLKYYPKLFKESKWVL
jgi:hypothetical protein